MNWEYFDRKFSTEKETSVLYRPFSANTFDNSTLEDSIHLAGDTGLDSSSIKGDFNGYILDPISLQKSLIYADNLTYFKVSKHQPILQKTTIPAMILYWCTTHLTFCIKLLETYVTDCGNFNSLV